MNKNTHSGIFLIMGSLLLTLTMILHPSGGSIEHILKIKKVIIGSHALAILSLPFLTLGFLGLSDVFATKRSAALLAFVISCFGLVATMLAAMINGLTLPIFLSLITETHYDAQLVKTITSYGHSLNVSLDYILMASITISVLIWSLLMILQRAFPKWLGYFGIALCLLGIVSALNRFDFISVYGFRFFIFGLVSWLVLTGLYLTRKSNSRERT